MIKEYERQSYAKVKDSGCGGCCPKLKDLEISCGTCNSIYLCASKQDIQALIACLIQLRNDWND